MKNKSKPSPPDTAPQRKPRKKTTQQPEPAPRPARWSRGGQAQDLTIVGIGASAGGLKALQAFFEALPNGTGLAFVVVTHLHPEHESHLAQILQRSTGMPVRQVTDQIQVKPNIVYVLPPNRQIRMTDTTLDVDQFDEPRGLRLPIDHFFRSLAKARRNAVGIILTGGGTDGSVGIKSIKEEGGLLMVQDPNEAEYDGMPRAAIATGIVDVVLPVRELAGKLVDYVQQPTALPNDLDELSPHQAETLQRILSHVQARTGHDFSQYKRTTIVRRVQRRMQLTGYQTLDTYLNYMRHTPNEAHAMFNDILIGVTNFFRDPKAWEVLAEKVLPAILEEKREGEPIRAWSIGCSTGEEAYTLGILLLEEAERREKKYAIQVFASDLDDASLELARAGIYPAAIEADLSPERLERFFLPHDDHYQVRRELRDIVLFANHSVLRDPPFSRLDLISCRNLLIYLQRDLHETVLDIFHYALKPEGYLFLGSSETAESVRELFHPVDKSHRIYKAKPWAGEQPHVPSLPLGALHSGRERAFFPSQAMHRRFATGMPSLEDQHLKALENLGPPSIWVDEDYLILNLSETAGRYLLQPGGPITSDLLQLVRPELRMELRSALFQAFEKGKASLSQPVLVSFNGAAHRVVISVRPDKRRVEQGSDSGRKALVVFLEDEKDAAIQAQEEAAVYNGAHSDVMVEQLEQEVLNLRERLHATVEEYNNSNEEMKATNEELQSINEEYRSTTEELETSREELQSVNEELQTVNSELRSRLEEISRAHSDIENLMDATKIATLFLDRDLKIKRHTPGMEELFNIAPSDRGRPISDFTHKLGYQDLVADARQVLQQLFTLERESTSPNGGWLLIRLRPYRTVDNRIEGVVISFVDITEVKKAERIRQNYESFYTLFHANPIPTLLIRLEDGVVMNANQALLDYLVLHREDVLAHTAQEFGLGLNLQSAQRVALTTKLLKEGGIRNFEEEIKLPSGQVKNVLTSIQYIYIEETDAIITTFIDITDRVLAERQIRQLTEDLTSAEQEERNRISRILHDDLQQRIFAVKMQLENTTEVLQNKYQQTAEFDFAKLEQWLVESIAITRQLSADLGPLDLQEEGFREVILWLASQMREQYGLEVEVDVDESEPRFERHLQIVLFHSIRELLFNVVKHAGTLQAQISLKKLNDGWIRVQVRDEGAGFDPAEIVPTENGVAHGLAYIQQRLQMFGCRLELDATPGSGTGIIMDCPQVPQQR